MRVTPFHGTRCCFQGLIPVSIFLSPKLGIIFILYWSWSSQYNATCLSFSLLTILFQMLDFPSCIIFLFSEIYLLDFLVMVC